MADSEIEQLMRATRQGGSSEVSEKEREMEQIRQENLDRVLDKDARQRLGTIKMVKPEKARKVEDAILRMAQVGQIRSKITEEQLKGILDQFNETQAKQDMKIVYNRKGFEDSDDEEYDLTKNDPKQTSLQELVQQLKVLQLQLTHCHSAHECAKTYPEIGSLLTTLARSRAVACSSEVSCAMLGAAMEYSKVAQSGVYANKKAQIWFSHLLQTQLRILGRNHSCIYELDDFVLVSDELTSQRYALQHLAKLISTESVRWDSRMKEEMWDMVFNACCGGDRIRLWRRLEMARAQLVLHLLQSQEQDRLGVESKTKTFTDSIMASRELAQQMVEDIAQLVLETRSKRVELEDQTDCDVVELFGSASSEQSRLWQQWHLIVQIQGLPPVAVLAVWLRIIAVASTDFAFSLLSRYFACKTGDSRMAKERAVALDVAAFVWSPLSAGTRAWDGVLSEWRRRIAC
ncbi:hypothetical protein IWW42_002159 [Coemansia sp. RSA 1085]|nr:hypothetical protein IWW42_002159 [Coemansia sp. RSA 1085]